MTDRVYEWVFKDADGNVLETATTEQLEAPDHHGWHLKMPRRASSNRVHHHEWVVNPKWEVLICAECGQSRIAKASDAIPKREADGHLVGCPRVICECPPDDPPHATRNREAEWCREDLPNGERCNKPAEFILWGKLFPKEGLGPRCYDHAAKHAGHRALGPRTVEQYAIYVLPRPS